MNDERAGLVVAVVDDDPSILESLALLLESADYEVRRFASGTALLQSACLPDIDCLISDIDMPGTDGFELLRIVHEARPGLPMIVITGYPDTLTGLPCWRGVKLPFFAKPFQAPELLATLSESLKGPRR